jgi:Predicted transcriptional regulators
MIGKMLKVLRSEKGYNQTELAKILNIAQTTLSGYETNYSNPSFDTIENIAKACDYEIIFRKKETKEEHTTKSVTRVDT